MLAGCINRGRARPGCRVSAAAFPLPSTRDDVQERREAHRAIAVSAIGLAATGIIELALAVLTGSVGLLGDATHNLSDVSTSAVVFLGFRLGDPIAGMAVTLFICHVGYEVTKDVVHRLADGVDPAIVTTAEAAARSVPGVIHAHARARWTGRTLRVEIEGRVDPDLPAREADALGRLVAGSLARQLPEAGSFTWTARAAPA